MDCWCLVVGKGALQPGAMFQQYAALVNAVNQNGQAELAGAKSGDLLSSVSGVSFIGKKMKDVITFIRKQKRPLTFQFRRRFQIDPEYPRIKYPRLDLVHMGWLEVDTEDVHYGKIRYWWKIDTHHQNKYLWWQCCLFKFNTGRTLCITYQTNGIITTLSRSSNSNQSNMWSNTRRLW